MICLAQVKRASKPEDIVSEILRENAAKAITVELVDGREEEDRWNKLIRKHHYLKEHRLVGESLRYVIKQDPQPVPRTLALNPKLLARSAEERHVPSLQRALDSLTIHKPHHQDFPVGGILHHSGKQSAHFVEVKFCIHIRTSSLGETKSPLSVVASAGRNS